ncbi:MAG: iron-containing alcohol dehydrogenase [Bacillota bacterium]|nr:iron-containing alcohol dehydrogenase [Bacillota bacterium]
MYQFALGTRVIVGEDILSDVAALVPPPARVRRNCSSDCGVIGVGVIADSGAWCRQPLEAICRALGGAGHRVVVFARVGREPHLALVAEGARWAREEQLGTLVAIGGGSSLDAAKAIAREAGITVACAVPTTAGTGSEVSPWAVVTDPVTRSKLSVETGVTPATALLDAGLTVSLDERTTLFTGVDAFSHAVEAYLSAEASSLTDAWALAAIQIVSGHLPRVLAEPECLASRRAMLEASLMAGVAMLHAGLGLAHALGNVYGGLCDGLPHGLVVGTFLYPVFRFNSGALPEKAAAVEREVESVMDLFRQHTARWGTGVPLPVPADRELLFARAARNVNARTNPRLFGPGDLADLVSTALAS